VVQVERVLLGAQEGEEEEREVPVVRMGGNATRRHNWSATSFADQASRGVVLSLDHGEGDDDGAGEEEEEEEEEAVVCGNVSDRVPVRTVDGLLVGERRCVRFAKLDLEGMEHDVLLGMQGVLRRCRPLLEFEAFTTPEARDQTLRTMHLVRSTFHYALFGLDLVASDGELPFANRLERQGLSAHDDHYVIWDILAVPIECTPPVLLLPTSSSSSSCPEWLAPRLTRFLGPAADFPLTRIPDDAFDLWFQRTRNRFWPQHFQPRASLLRHLVQHGTDKAPPLDSISVRMALQA
jgi:FkbM family methyltransferase